MSGFNTTQRQIWRKILREKLTLEDIKSICYDLVIEYEDLVGDTKSEKITSLLDQLFRENRLDKFKEYLTTSGDYSYISLPALGELVGESPYVGLKAFKEANAKNFYGREAFVAQLEAAILKQPFVPVLGPSGSGKSSLMFAGLLPQISQRPDWAIATTRPLDESSPVKSLVSALLTPTLQDKLPHQRRSAIQEAAEAIESHSLTLMDLVTDMAVSQPSVENLLIYIDQFEELFTGVSGNQENENNQEEVTRFIVQLSQLIRAQSRRIRLVVVLTMRADFLGVALTYPELADLLNHYPDVKLRALKIERDPERPDDLSEIERAIVLPAQNAGASFQDGLVQRIIEDLGEGAGKLPLLQFALTELWNVQENGLLTHDGYNFIGQVDGALANHANGVFEELSDNEKKQARFLFTQLVQPGRGTVDTRRIASKAELGDKLWALAQKFAQEELRLVTIETDEEQKETVQVTHEALITNWSRLKDWMKQDRAFREWQEQFRSDVQLWLDKNRLDSFLYGGARLAQSTSQIQLRNPQLSPDEQAFIDTSNAKEDQERQRELDEAKKLAEAKQNELAAEQRRARITHIALGVISVLLIGSVWAAVSAIQNARNATFQSLKAQTQSLMSLSTTMLPDQVSPSVTQVEEAILMGVQGVRNNTANNGALLTKSFENEQLRELMTELDIPAWEGLPMGSTDLFPGDWPFVQDLAVSADGRYVAAAEEFGYIYLWDLDQPDADPAIFDTEFDPDGFSFSVEFSPDGEYFVTQDNGVDLGFWHPDNTDTPFLVLQGHDSFVNLLDMSADGRWLASADWDQVVHVWDLNNLTDATRPTYTLTETELGAFLSITLAPDGRQVYIVHPDSTITAWALTPNIEQLFSIETAFVPGAAADISPDGSMLAVGDNFGNTHVYDLGEINAPPRQLGGQVSDVTDIRFAANGEKIAIANDDKSVFVWQLDETDAEPIRLQGHPLVANAVVFLPDDNQLISAGQDSPILFWDISTQNTSNQVIEQTDWVHQVAWSPAGNQLAAARRDGTVRLINPINLAANQVLPVSDQQSRVRDVAYSDDGQWMAAVAEDEKIRVWSLDQTDQTATFETDLTLDIPQADIDDNYIDISYLAFRPNSHEIVSIVNNYILHSWAADDWQGALNTVELGGLDYTAFAFSPDGSQIALGDDEYTITVYNYPITNVSTPLYELSGNVHNINSIAFSPDGNWLASGNDFSQIWVWDLNNLDQEGTALMEHTAFIWTVSFSPDSSQLLSASDDNTLRIWDMTDLTVPSQLLEGHESFAWSAEFSPDGNYIASGSSDGTVRIWPTLDTLVELACERVTRNMTQEEWNEFLPNIPYETTCPNLPPHPSTQ